MLTLGIDLAAQPKTTGVALIEWEPGGARLRELSVGADDAALLELIARADKAAIDAPLGWPDEFVAAVSAHQAREGWPGRGEDPDGYRFRLSFRLTDRRLIESGVRRPLSVSTDLIGVVAMRAAKLLDELASRGEPVDRGGSGKVLEAYPAPAMAGWNVNAAGYKGKGPNRLPILLEALEEGVGGLGIDPLQHRLATTDHNALDAIVASLVARAAALGLTAGPEPGEEADRAAREGWIRMPTNPLSDLRVPA